MVGLRPQPAVFVSASQRTVHVPRDQQREIVRLLYVATRNQAKALIATLECEGLE